MSVWVDEETKKRKKALELGDVGVSRRERRINLNLHSHRLITHVCFRRSRMSLLLEVPVILDLFLSRHATPDVCHFSWDFQWWRSIGVAQLFQSCSKYSRRRVSMEYVRVKIIIIIFQSNSFHLNLVVDCAEGTTRQFALQPQGQRYLKAGKVTKIFITHMHG